MKKITLIFIGFLFFLCLTACGAKPFEIVLNIATQTSSIPTPLEVVATLTPTPQPTPTFNPTPTLEIPKPVKRPFDVFVDSIKTDDAGRIVGIYAEDKLALKVVYQPSNNPGFVSTLDGVVTYFLMPYQMSKNHGFLAHNYLSGGLFFGMQLGDIVQVIWGDGYYEDFEVMNIEQYQALSPTSPSSRFVNLATGDNLSASSLFTRVYRGSYHTTLQTCIAQGSEDSWGRIFIIAPPTY